MICRLVIKFLIPNPAFPVLQENLGKVSSCHEMPPLSENVILGAESDLPSSKKLKTDENNVSIEILKRTCEDNDELFQKRSETVIIESDDEMQTDSKPALQTDRECSSARVEKVFDFIDLDPSQP